MKRLCCFLFLLLASVSLYSQVEPSATGGATISLDDTAMMTPAPVGGAYQLEGTRSNYLNVGLVVTPAYTDNVYSGSARKIGDEEYSIQPTLGLNRDEPRQSESVEYSPGFTFYQHTTQLSGMTQQGTGDYKYHLTKYTTFTVGDTFYQNSNLYNQPNPFAPGSVNPAAPGAGIFPFANLLSNTSYAGISYQYARNAMIGAGGSFITDRYDRSKPNDVQPQGLEDLNDTGASAFFSRRLTRAHYIGLTYQFAKIVTFPVRSYSYTNTAMGFLTFYLSESFSLSISGGSQHYDASDQTGAASAWTPAVEGSLGWRGKHGGIAASYSRMVSNSNTAGLLGIYHTNAFDGGASWQLARRWSLNFGGGYSRYDLVRLNEVAPSQDTTAAYGSTSLTHPLSERLSAALTYAHFHQDSGLGFAVPFPESNRISFSISYAFSRPLGR